MKLKIYIPRFIARFIFPKSFGVMAKEADYLASIGRKGVSTRDYSHPAQTEPVLRMEVESKRKS